MHSALSCHYNELMLVAAKWLLEPLEWCRLPYKVTFFETVKLWLKQRLNPGIQTFFHCLFFISELLFFFFFVPSDHTCGYKGIFILLILHIRAPYDVQGLFVVDSNGTPGADCRLFSLPSTLQNVQMSFDVGCFLWTRQLGPKAALFQKKKIWNKIKFSKKKSRRHITPMVEERVRLFLAARLQFLMWGSTHRPRQTAHMNYVCLSLLLYVSLWLIFEKSFWQSSHRSVFWIVKSSGRSLWFFLPFLFFFFLFFAQFYPGVYHQA